MSHHNSRHETIFKEQQRFRQWWLWLLLLLAPMGYTFWELYQAPEPAPWSVLLGSSGLLLLVVFLFLILRLDSEIREDGIYVRFFPFALQLKRYGWEEIEKAYVRTYLPLREYGGWGVRYGIGGKALNVSGNKGLQLELKNGKKLLIGTRQPHAIAAALAQASAH